MKIRLMEEKDFSEVATIDCAAFVKDTPRPVENLAMMRNTLPGCAYVAEIDGKAVGYTFSKKMGEESYIGPLGFPPDFQHMGYGSILIKESLDYLKQHCTVIGLEVRPLKVWNIGLYSSLGFETTFPTFIYELKDFDYKPDPGIKVLKVSEANEAALDLSGKIEEWLQAEYGLSYKEDLIGILQAKGKAVIALQNDAPVGFLAHGGFLSPHVWGAVRRKADQLEIFKALLKSAPTAFPGKLMMGVNSRYHNVISLMTDLRFNIDFVMNRMLAKGYGGKFFELDDGISIRSWMG